MKRELRPFRLKDSLRYGAANIVLRLLRRPLYVYEAYSLDIPNFIMPARSKRSIQINLETGEAIMGEPEPLDDVENSLD